MKALICGSRDWTDFSAIVGQVERLPADAVVITGRAQGADSMARSAAVTLGLWVVDVPVEKSHWNRYGRSAGHKRNHLMLDLDPDIVIAFQRDGSPGTQGTIDEARRRDITVWVFTDADAETNPGAAKADGTTRPGHVAMTDTTGEESLAFDAARWDNGPANEMEPRRANDRLPDHKES